MGPGSQPAQLLCHSTRPVGPIPENVSDSAVISVQPRFPIPVVLSQMSCSCCHVLAVLPFLSCPACTILTIFSHCLLPLSCPSCPVQAFPSQLSFPSVLSQLSFPNVLSHSVVLSHLSFPQLLFSILPELFFPRSCLCCLFSSFCPVSFVLNILF
jgi:hypothetical protein